MGILGQPGGQAPVRARCLVAAGPPAEELVPGLGADGLGRKSSLFTAVAVAGLGKFLNIDIDFSRHRKVEKNISCGLKK